ncbi:MAG: cysteine-rich small domain-containing protein [Halobacteriota archaeon]
MTDTTNDTEEEFPEELKRKERLKEPEGLPKGNECPYYPCHFSGQVCVFCYCPKYPCEDRKLGRWIRSSKGDVVWTCVDCTLLHKKKVADYLHKHPDASIEELKQIEAEH